VPYCQKYSYRLHCFFGDFSTGQALAQFTMLMNTTGFQCLFIVVTLVSGIMYDVWKQKKINYQNDVIVVEAKIPSKLKLITLKEN